MLVSYRRLSAQFQFSLSADTLGYLSQWVQRTVLYLTMAVTELYNFFAIFQFLCVLSYKKYTVLCSSETCIALKNVCVYECTVLYYRVPLLYKFNYSPFLMKMFR